MIVEPFWLQNCLQNRSKIDPKSSRMQKNTKSKKPMKTIVFTMFFEGPGLQKPKMSINFSLKNLSGNR